MYILCPTKHTVEDLIKKIFPNKENKLNGPDNKLWERAENFSKDIPDQFGQLDLGIDKLSGIDIPIILSNDSDYKKRSVVAIVAQDPYRNAKDKLFDKIDKSKTIIGTPFAFHYKREAYPKTIVYRNIVNSLIDKKYNVYLTDAHKFYPNRQVREEEISCLKNELEVIKPKLVVAFGTDARDYLEEINNSIQNKFVVVPLPHPSQNNWVYWKLFIFSQAWGDASGKLTSTIDWSSYASRFTVKSNEYGNSLKSNFKMDNTISEIALKIIFNKL